MTHYAARQRIFFSQEGCGYLHRNTMGEVIVQVRVRGLIQKGEQ